MLSIKLNGELRLQMTFFYTENAHQTSVCTLHVIYHRQVTLNCLFISTNGHRLHNKMCQIGASIHIFKSLGSQFDLGMREEQVLFI